MRSVDDDVHAWSHVLLGTVYVRSWSFLFQRSPIRDSTCELDVNLMRHRAYYSAKPQANVFDQEAMLTQREAENNRTSHVYIHVIGKTVIKTMLITGG